MPTLLERTCRSAGVIALHEGDIASQLAQVNGWQRDGDAIAKTFTFSGDLEAAAFVGALAWMCHVENHHPEVLLRFDRCRVSFSTHSVGAVTLNDFICAAKADALVAVAR